MSDYAAHAHRLLVVVGSKNEFAPGSCRGGREHERASDYAAHAHRHLVVIGSDNEFAPVLAVLLVSMSASD